jgi:hypothetical protein
MRAGLPKKEPEILALGEAWTSTRPLRDQAAGPPEVRAA